MLCSRCRNECLLFCFVETPADSEWMWCLLCWLFVCWCFLLDLPSETELETFDSVRWGENYLFSVQSSNNKQQKIKKNINGMTALTVAQRQSALRLYRQLYRRSHLIPQYDKQQKTIADIRSSFKQVWSLRDPPREIAQGKATTDACQNSWQEFMNRMHNRLSFIEMTTPKMSNLSAIRHIHEMNNTPIDYSNHGTRHLFVVAPSSSNDNGEIIDVNQQVKESHQNGQVLNGNKKDKAAVSNWTYGNIDPDHIKRHEQLLRRQRFMEGPLKDYPRNVHGIDKW